MRRPSAVADAGNGPPLMRRPSAVADAGNGPPLMRRPSAVADAGNGPPLMRRPSAVADAGNGPPLMRRPSAVADAGNGAPLNWRPSANAVAGRGHMIVETEPNGLMMIRYKLYFNQQNTDPEDPWVLAYFQEHGLEPRRELYEEHEGIPYKVFHFGQCYLGRHVTALGALYQRGIEHTVLAQYLFDFLSHTEDVGLSEATAGLDT